MRRYRPTIADIDDIAHRTGLPYEDVEMVLKVFLKRLEAKGYRVVSKDSYCYFCPKA